MKALCSIAILFFLVGASHARDATIADVIKFLKDGNKQWNAVMIGVGTGIEGANVYSDREHSQKLFCPPGNLAITSDQYVRILESFVEKNPRWGNAGVNLLGWVLMNAVTDVFPCKH